MQRKIIFREADHTPYLKRADLMGNALFGKPYHELGDFEKNLIIKNWENTHVLNRCFDKMKNPQADLNIERLMKGEKIELC